MKFSDVLILGAAAAAAFFIVGMAGKRSGAGKSPGGASLITEWNGWQYFTDGTVIDPFGSYYYRGEKVFDATWGDV